jgi:hypothetical protein
VTVFGIQFDPCKPFDVQNVRPVNPDEPRRIELLFAAAQSLLLEKFLPTDNERRVVILRKDVVDFCYGNDIHIRARANQNTLDRRVTDALPPLFGERWSGVGEWRKEG